MRHYQALPWIMVFVVALLVLAFLAWLGYDNWSDIVQ
jgi:hypothetical protein